nr:ras-like GTP-binding protein RhoL isoform X2 [Procambarus clarkii]
MSQRPLKITVVGDGYVGKTSLLVSYTTGKFPEEYIPTVFDNYTGKHTLMQRTYPITLWDSAGQEDYELLRPLSYPGTNVFIVCFALDNHNSFENVTSKWLPELHQKCPKAPIVLVGAAIKYRTSGAGCCRVLQGAAGCCRVVQGGAGCCRLLQAATGCYRLL